MVVQSSQLSSALVSFLFEHRYVQTPLSCRTRTFSWPPRGSQRRCCWSGFSLHPSRAPVPAVRRVGTAPDAGGADAVSRGSLRSVGRRAHKPTAVRRGPCSDGGPRKPWPPGSGETGAAWGRGWERGSGKEPFLPQATLPRLASLFAADSLSLPSSLGCGHAVRQYSAGLSPPTVLAVPHTQASLSLRILRRLTALALVSPPKSQPLAPVLPPVGIAASERFSTRGRWRSGVGPVFAVRDCLTGCGTFSIPGVNKRTLQMFRSHASLTETHYLFKFTPCKIRLSIFSPNQYLPLN